MNLDIAAVMGVPYSGCELCDEVVVMGESCAEDISWAWETHLRGPVHQAGGRLDPDPEPDMTPPEGFRDIPESHLETPIYPSPYGPYGYAEFLQRMAMETEAPHIVQ